MSDYKKKNKQRIKWLAPVGRTIWNHKRTFEMIILKIWRDLKYLLSCIYRCMPSRQTPIGCPVV